MRYYLWIVLAVLSLGACRQAEPIRGGEFILAESDLPEYESQLDHAGLIADYSEEFYHRGTAIYRTACFSCHGNLEQPGTIPGSRQFWAEPFILGDDPFSLYQTLTRGRGLMPPQVNLTPREKYQVIHFIREEFIREHNPSAYFPITDAWMAQLPRGDTYGPEPSRRRPWEHMDYGPFLMRTYEIADSTAGPKDISRGPAPLPNEDFTDRNFAYKGIAVRLDSGSGGVAAGQAFALFDHDLMRLAAIWTGVGFIDWEDILLDDQHNVFPRIVGKLHIENPSAPGWAHPTTRSFEDPRFRAVDGRQFGPLPREWAHYEGLYQFEERIVIRYTVGGARILESYALEQPGIWSRTLNITNAHNHLLLRAAPDSAAVALVPGSVADLYVDGGFHMVRILKDGPFKLLYGSVEQDQIEEIAQGASPAEDLTVYTAGGPTLYPETLTSPILVGDQEGYAVDVLTLPYDNPWQSRMRPTGIDFLEGGDEAVVSTIDGEVWKLSNLTQLEGPIRWRRIATGLFQPLGIKIWDGDVFVSCRDQIVRLVDLNGDGATDYYESFNSDHQVTEHFHEFAMGLQTDSVGNFYYAKSARHARTALVPQHGTLIRVSADGERSTILANGFRAANGVLLNPDGSFIVTDQEGHWNPMNRINYVTEGGFYGNMYGFGAPADSSDAAMIQPLLWIDQRYDRSPAELLWADSDRWGPLGGHLLSFSYGYGRVFLVMPQVIGDQRQGAIVELPLPEFPTGIMRGRFNPGDGQLYVAGMSAWATNQMIQTGGLYRIRYAGGPVRMPVAFKALTGALEITFAESLDHTVAMDPDRYTVNAWDLERTRRYGSERINERTLDVTAVSVLSDRTVRLEVPSLAPTWILEVLYDFTNASDGSFEGAIQSTVYTLEP